MRLPLKNLGAYDIVVRESSGKCGPLVTDNACWILDCRFDLALAREAKMSLEAKINNLPGVLENGIFARIRPAKEDCLIYENDKRIFYEKP